MRVTVTVSADEHYYLYASPRWLQHHDNGALVSCGLTVGRDGFTVGAWKRAKAKFRTVPLTKDEYKHSGCQSYCVRRGNSECRW